SVPATCLLGGRLPCRGALSLSSDSSPLRRDPRRLRRGPQSSASARVLSFLRRGAVDRRSAIAFECRWRRADARVFALRFGMVDGQNSLSLLLRGGPQEAALFSNRGLSR